MSIRLLQDKSRQRFDWRLASVYVMTGFLAAILLWIGIIWIMQR
ncbi:hypothetical protein [Paenibacillus sp. UNC451MF]|nr:hypothetical protein [Paenibacillus sp. UNC451MF]